MMNRLEALRSFKEALRREGIEEYDAEARIALSAFLGIELYELMSDKAIPEDTETRIAEAVRRRAEGEPMAYIIGERWFMGMPFYVDERVLIPRSETEILAERAITLARVMHEPRIIDLCTGSGCIAVSIATETDARVSATDISEGALTVAKKNAETNGAKIDFLLGDLFAGAQGPFDMVTANPPYVSEAEYATLSREVKREPIGALVAEDNGYALIERIANEAAAKLRKGGVLLMEIGADQAERTLEIFRKAGFDANIMKDLCGRDRVAVGVKEE